MTVEMILDSSTPAYLKCLWGVLSSGTHYGVPGERQAINLRESDDGNNPNTLTSVWVVDLPRNSIVIDADKLPYSILETNKRQDEWPSIDNYRHVSDYVILSEADGVYYHLYVEMKTGYQKRTYIPQLRCARAQLEHLMYLIRHFDGKIFPENIRHRFVKFSKLPLFKRTTTGMETFSGPDKPNVNDEPCKTYQRFVNDDEYVSFNELIDMSYVP